MTQKNAHSAIISDKNRIVLTSVHSVESFDDRLVQVFTAAGDVRIRGRELQVESADTDGGDAVIVGKIRSVSYTDSDEHIPVNIISRIFR